MWEFLGFILSLFFTTPDDGHCRELIHHEVEHVVCSYAVKEISIKFYHKDEQEIPYETAKHLKRALKQKNKIPLMVMNGGMYHEDLSPVGLYIEDGHHFQKISTKSGWGNFHLLPNGIFWIENDRLGIEETHQFIASKRVPQFATQSGPMLLINGKIHPKFIENSTSRKIRNGVGLSKDKTKIHFALSKSEINFHNFATLFRDQLDAHNALFLDGTVSSIETQKYSISTWHDLGIFIGVFKQKKN